MFVLNTLDDQVELEGFGLHAPLLNTVGIKWQLKTSI